MNLAEAARSYYETEYFWAEGPLCDNSINETELSKKYRLPLIRLDGRALADRRLNFCWLDNEPFYSEMPHLKIARGVVGLTNLCIRQEIDTLFLLDKSARPYGYLFLKTWRGLYPETRPPKVKFIKIRRINETYEQPENLTDDTYGELRNRYIIKDGEKIAVIDDFSNYNKTIRKATYILRRAFKKSEIYSAYILDNMASWHGKEGILGVENGQSPQKKKFLTEPVIWRMIYDKEVRPAVQLRSELRMLAANIAECAKPLNEEVK